MGSFGRTVTAYHELYTIVSEAVVGFANLYGYGAAKFEFLSELLGARFSFYKILTASALVF
jgi:hypothetical protein